MEFEEIRQELMNAAEPDFAAFSGKIIPTGYPMLGVRTPTVKKIAKQASERYLDCEPEYYEELLVQGFALGRIANSADALFERLPQYLSRVDNWAAIDSPLSAMKALKKKSEREQCLEYIEGYAGDGREYFARFGCVALFDYLDGEHIDRTLELYNSVPSGRYYVDMAIAWGLSIAAIDHYDKVYAALEEGKFSEFITRKTVSKCRDSFRITPERKRQLKELIRKLYIK